MRFPDDSTATGGSRRRFLRLAVPATVAALAGCTGDDGGSDGTTRSRSGSTAETTEPTSTTDVGTTATTTPATLTGRLARHAVALDTVDPTSDLEDLRRLSSVLARPTVLGLGEATHGTREFFRLKHRLIRFLATEHDVRLIGLEANLSATLAINEYVLGGEGDPASALDAVRYWTWDVESMRSLVEWLREFNRERSPGEKVRFHGFDVNFTRAPARRLRAYLRRVDPDALDRYDDTLTMLSDGGLRVADADLRERRLTRTAEVVDELENRFQARRESYVAATSARAWRLARRHLWIVERNRAGLRGAMQDGTDAYHRVRDRAMAENVAWLLDHESADGIVVLAHNSHVARGPLFDDVAAMGRHLDGQYGEAYLPVALEFGYGSFQATSGARDSSPEAYSVGRPPDDAVPGALLGTDGGQFYLDVAGATARPELADWLDDPRRLHDVGAVYRGDPFDEYVVADAFDGILFVERSTRARPLDAAGAPARPAGRSRNRSSLPERYGFSSPR